MAALAWSHQSLSLSQSEENYTHSYKRLLLIFFTIIIFITSLCLNALNPSGSILFGLNFNSESQLNDNEHVPHSLVSSSWPNFVWISIYLWQLAWLIYGITTICRKSSSDYLYKYPPVMHWIVYLNFSIANILNFFCVTLWSNGYYELTAFYSVLIFVSLYIAVFVSLFKLSDYQREMYYTEKTKDVWSIRLLVQNGMFMYASWSFLMFLLILSTILTNKYNVSKDSVQLVIFLILFIKLIIYFFIENFIAYKHCKFILTPWLVYGLFFSNLISSLQIDFKQSSDEDMDLNYFFHIFLISFFVFLFISKLVKFICSEIFYQNRFSANF